jgi:hypothetical protein
MGKSLALIRLLFVPSPHRSFEWLLKTATDLITLGDTHERLTNAETRCPTNLACSLVFPSGVQVIDPTVASWVFAQQECLDFLALSRSRTKENAA